MPRSSTPTFITDVPLIVTSTDERELTARFNAGLRLLNNCLGEAQTRMRLVRKSELFQQALKLPKTIKNDKGKDVANPLRRDAFKAAREAHRYSEYDLHAYAGRVAKDAVWIAQKLDANTIQKIATRVFKATERVLLGRAKKIRFKGFNRFRSVEGKSNKTGIRWKDNQLVWGDLILQPLIGENDPVLLHGLNSPVKYVRLIKRELNGKTRYFAQLVNEGLPFQKPKNTVGDDLIGLDLNVSAVAVVGDTRSELLPFANKVPTYDKEIAALQRQMQRSQRTSNPENYEPNFEARKGRKTVTKLGKPKKGKRKWRKSKRYLRIAQKKRELQRRKAAYAKSENRKLVNDTLRIGKTIKTENVSVKGWQKRYGKAIGAKSPGFFMSELVRKAERAGGQVIKFSTQRTALSQTHLSGERVKKSLSERIHKDVTGFEMHRDLFSAFLARYVVEDQLLLQAAQFEYPGLEPALMEAWQRYLQSANQVGSSERRQAQPPSERISINSEKANQIGDSCKSVRQVG
jgi:hypothetical protein